MLIDLLSSVFISFAPSLLLVVLILALLGRIISQWLRLRNIPGPFIAKFTDFWRFRVVRRGLSHQEYLRLHDQHGDFVRIGPNIVSIRRPDLAGEIYGINKGFAKSDWYSVWQNVVNGKRAISLVFSQNDAQHAKLKRPIASAFALSTLVKFEPLLDSTTAVFLSRLDELFATTQEVCDLGAWLQWYAFDVMGELTFSKRLGFMEQAEDVEGIIASIQTNFVRCSSLGQIPWVDALTYKNPIYLKFFAKKISSPIIAFGQRRLQQRLNEKHGDTKSVREINGFSKNDEKVQNAVSKPEKQDFLSRYLQVHNEQPELVNETMVLALLFSNVHAGSDTVASTVRAIFYHLLKNPETLDRLKKELNDAARAGTITVPLPKWTECQDLSYLNAVIKEALRINPALSLPMERVVPSSGLQVGDTFFPPGIIVGINPWALHRDKRIFGEDADVWRPERWLEDEQRNKYMDRNMLSFSMGSRTCLGRHIAMLELTKIVSALVLRYDITLSEPEKEWTVTSAWVIKHDGLNVFLRRRDIL